MEPFLSSCFLNIPYDVYCFFLSHALFTQSQRENLTSRKISNVNLDQMTRCEKRHLNHKYRKWSTLFKNYRHLLMLIWKHAFEIKEQFFSSFFKRILLFSLHFHWTFFVYKVFKMIIKIPSITTTRLPTRQKILTGFMVVFQKKYKLN